MLNITGGGENRIKAEKELFWLKPRIIFDMNPDAEEVKKLVEGLFI
jgi:cysteate synthase